jgi:hypothetical protein
LDLLDGSSHATELHDATRITAPRHQVMELRRMCDGDSAQLRRIGSGRIYPNNQTYSASSKGPVAVTLGVTLASCDRRSATESGLLLPGDRLDPAEYFLDALADALANDIAAVPGRSPVNRRAAAAVFWATCGVTFIERSSLRKFSASQALSAPSVIAVGRSARGSIMCSAATRSRAPADGVRCFRGTHRLNRVVGRPGTSLKRGSRSSALVHIV